MQLETKSADYPQNSRELGVPGWRQSFVQALPSKARRARDVGVFAIILAALLNPGSFGASLPVRGWRGIPTICKVLLLGGAAADLIGLMLIPTGI